MQGEQVKLYSNRQLRDLLIPLLIEQTLVMLVGMADTVMVSSLGEAAVSGVSLVDQLCNVLLALFAALATGGAVVAAQMLGAQRRDQACKSSNQLVLVALGVSLVIMVPVLAFKRELFTLMFSTVEEDVLNNALTYLTITAASYPFIALYNAGAALCRSMNRSRVTMIVSLIVNAVNIVGNALGVYVLHCGVALKLVLALGGPDREEPLFARYCTLAAIGTVADVMQMSGENRTIVSRGLATLEHSDFIGLHALLREAGLSGKEISSVQIGFVLAPRINAAGRMGAADKAAELLLCTDPAAAEAMAKELCALNRERQNVEQDIYTQAEEMIDRMPERQRSALVLESSRWHQGVVGIVASRLSEKYSRPSFMIHLNGSTGKGSCRSWGGFNLFAALENCKDLLLGFGGHELAAGFTIDRSNIPAFRDRMNEYARSYCGGQQPESALEIDVAIAHPAAVTLEELEALSVLEPYGSGNARPLFCLLGATLLRTQNVGQNRHLKLRLGKGCAQFDGIFFSTVAERCGCHPGDRVDAAFYLQINEFRGSRTVQLQMVDIRPSLCASGREQEALTLAHRCAAGKAVSLREARRALPTREQFAAAWRFLDRTVPEDGLTTDRLPLLRLMAAELGGAEPVLRAAMCAAVFRERGLLDWQLNGDAITLHLRRGQHVALDQSPLMNTLQNDNEKGGGAL